MIWLNNETLVSIVIPVYNAERYINECINSILEQTFQDFEIILIDDGSTDRSVEIIKSYNNKKINLICNTHNYIHSLNLGMNKAKGKYIARMDSDDIMVANRLELQYKYMESHPDIDICGGAAQCFGKTKKQITVNESHIDIISNMILYNPIIHPTVIMRKQVIYLFPQENGIYLCYNPKYRYAEDYKIWTDFVIKGCRFANIPNTILRYRTSENQITHKKYNEMMRCSCKISAEYMERIGNLITTKDKQYQNIFNEVIQIYNNGKLTFHDLQKIIYTIFRSFLLYNS